MSQCLPADPDAVIQTPARELAAFRDTLERPTLAMGLAYLHVAAGALQQGILLLCTDRRVRNAVGNEVHDFGTQQYDTSIVLLFQVGSVNTGSRGDGHFDTVCLLAPGQQSPTGDAVATVFERNHELLRCLRSWTTKHSDTKTMAGLKVQYTYHRAISMSPERSLRGWPLLTCSRTVPSAVIWYRHSASTEVRSPG